MTPEQFKAARKSRGWDQAKAAASLKVSIHTVRAWEQDKNPVPHWVEKEMLSEAELKVPLDLITQINEIAASEKISFDHALAKTLREGLSITQSPKTAQSAAKRKK